MHSLYSSNFIFKSLQILAGLLLPVVLISEDFILYNKILALINLVFVIGSIQLVTLYSVRYYQDGVSITPVVASSLVPLLVAISIALSSLLLDHTREFVMVTVGSISLCFSNFVVTYCRLTESWKIYLMNGLLITAPLPLLLAFCSILDVQAQVWWVFSALTFGWLGSCVVGRDAFRIENKAQSIISLLSENWQQLLGFILLQVFIFSVFGVPRLLLDQFNSSVVESLFLLPFFNLIFFVVELLFERRRPQLLSSVSITRQSQMIILFSLAVIIILSGIFLFFGVPVLNAVYSEKLRFDVSQFMWVPLFLGSCVFMVQFRWIILWLKSPLKFIVIAIFCYLSFLFLGWQGLYSELDNGGGAQGLMVLHSVALITSIFVARFCAVSQNLQRVT